MNKPAVLSGMAIGSLIAAGWFLIPRYELHRIDSDTYVRLNRITGSTSVCLVKKRETQEFLNPSVPFALDCG